jgi:hypothetical protein
MSKTALLEALKTFDLDRIKALLRAAPELRDWRDEKGLNLLHICSKRSTADDAAAARRQLQVARWLVSEGFDPKATHTTAAGEDGEEDPATVSLAWFAVARARNNALARYFLEQGAAPGALFAAAWWGNAGIIPDLVRHGADLNEVVGAPPLLMAVDVVQRGAHGNPELARARMNTLTELLRLGADPNLPAFDGTTALHHALKKEYLEAFKVLLQHGANPDLPGKDGRTVREIASRKRDTRYFEALGKVSAGRRRAAGRGSGAKRR